MERIRRAAAVALKGACASVLGSALLAGGAHAAQGLVVQKREAGTQLLAHRYEAGPTGSQKLTVVVKPNTDFKTVTLLDYDRDGSPDGYVNMYWNPPTQRVVWQLWVFTKDPMTTALGSGGGTCFVPAPTNYAYNSSINPGGHDVALDKRAGSWSATVTADFADAFGDNARYQPRMVTLYTASANALGNSGTADDYLPDSAAPGVAPADTGCLGRSPDESSGSYRPGFLISRDGWSDRGQVTGPPVRRQTMFDNDDGGNSNTDQTDLLEADVEQYNASQQLGDVTSATADTTTPSTAAFHPSDLVLRFDAHGGSVASDTYIFNASGNAPVGLVVTDAGPDAFHATVQLHYNLSGLTGDTCYPRSATAKLSSGSNTRWGPEPLALTLPITTDEQGRRVVRVALDHLTGVYQQAANADALEFRWATAGVRGALDPDYVPNTLNAAFCTFPGDNSPGTYVKASEAIRMGGDLPPTVLTASDASPGRSDPITLTATGGTHFRFQPHDADGFDANWASGNRYNVVYPTAQTARVLARSSAGTNQMAQLRIAPENTPPTAGWAASGPAQPWLLGSPSGITVVWNDDSHDSDPGGTIARQSWTLTNTRTGTAYMSDTSSIAHTFVLGDQGDWTLEHTVFDDQGAANTKTLTYAVIQPPVAIIDKITPCHGAGNCDTEPGPIVWNQYTGGQYRAWARTATDGSLGSRGPLDYYFQWEPPNGSYNRWTLGYGDSFFSFPGSYTINMKVVDADGRESAPTSARVNVRAPGDRPPTAHATLAPAQPQSGDDVLIDASASVLNNPDGTTEKPFLFRYDFGDGTAPLTTTQHAVHHVYAGSGLYHVTVVAIDDRSFANNTESDPLVLDLRVVPGAVDANAPAAALARLAPAGKVYADRDVQLSAAASVVKAGPATYAFDLDGNGSYETDNGTQAVLTTRFATAGHRDIRVRVTDGEGRVAVSAAVGLDVLPAPVQPPTVVLTGPDVVSQGADGVATAALDASASHGNNDDPSLSYIWDLDGDGVYETDTGSTPKATARLRNGGDQTVRVLATDPFGNRAGATKTIFVRSTADIAAGCKDREQYRDVTYKLVRVYGCWVSVDRPNAGKLWIATGDVLVNGLRLTAGSKLSGAKAQQFNDCGGAACLAAQSRFNDEGQGRRFVLDPADGRFASNAPASVKAVGSGVTLTLADEPIDTLLPETKADDGLMLHPPGGAKLLSLDLASTAEVTFPAIGQASVALSVHLPPEMPGAGGDLTLRATESQGLIIDKLRIEVQAGLLSDYLKFGSIALEYDRAEDQWDGSAEFGLPAIKKKEFGLEVEVVVKNGRFKSIYGAVDGLNVALGEGVFLQKVRAGVGVNPLDLQGGIGISAGPKIAGTSLLSADGDFRVTFPSQQYPYTLFQISGGTKLFDYFDLERGVLRFTTNGFFEARYGYTRDVGIAYFDADIGGWFTTSKANFTGNAEAGIKFLGDRVKLVGAKAVLSTRGIAACGEIPVIHLGGGVGYRWGDDFNVFEGCDLGPYSEARPEGIPEGFSVRAVTAATRAPAVTLPAKLRSAGITVTGRGGAPLVKVVDAQGRTVLDATKESLTAKAMVVLDQQNATTQILWKAPPQGKYLVLAAEGSPAIAKVRQAVDAGPQRVKASVTTVSGGKRKLTWTVTPALQKGQELLLGEATALDGAGAALTTTTKSKGSLVFTPQAGHGERRVVTATIQTNGLGRPSTVAARFTAPKAVTPARPAAVALTRKGRTVTLRWTPAKGAAAPEGGWRVATTVGALRSTRTIVGAGVRTVKLDDVPAGVKVSATVTGLTASRVAGAARGATLAAGASRSGAASGAAAARPRGLKATRSGRRLVVRWSAGTETPRGYVVTVKIGKAKAITLGTGAKTRKATIAGLPKGRTTVAVSVRARRIGGGLSPAATVRGRR
jgi:hypothetical protein